MKVYLLGYMGSGKSTVGKMLADQLQMNFLDFDRYIEKETGKTIPEIFDSLGEDKFRELEHTHLKNVLHLEDTVISLGGGTPCFHNNIDLINSSGTSVYIEMAVDELVKRLANARNKRPLIRGLNDAELKLFIEANLEKRKPVYEKAHFSVNATTLSAEQAAATIAKNLKDKISRGR